MSILYFHVVYIDTWKRTSLSTSFMVYFFRHKCNVALWYTSNFNLCILLKEIVNVKKRSECGSGLGCKVLGDEYSSYLYSSAPKCSLKVFRRDVCISSTNMISIHTSENGSLCVIYL